MKSGVLNLYKEAGFTSHDAVAKLRGILGTRKIGHTGTLDPNATGVLPILVGNAAKACDLIPEETKIYRARLRFGLKTDTEDIWGQVLATDEKRPDEGDVRRAMEAFSGEYMQTPPMVSAVKVGGKKLYEYAREGIEIPRAARRVFVHRFELLSFSSEEAEFRAEVSKGTYIRTLLTDLCRKVGVLGAMSALEREKSGMFTLSDAVTLKELEAFSAAEREALLVPTERLFESHSVFHLPLFFDRLVANGCAVSVKKLKLEHVPAGERFRLYRDGAFFALGEVKEYEDGKKLVKIKNFPSDE